MKPVNIGIAGLGTVGAGTVHVLARNADEIKRRAGRTICITHVAMRDKNKTRGCAGHLKSTKFVQAMSLATEDQVSVVVELIGGTDIARELVLACITNGKHVVTANKALIALHGNEIFAAARAHGVVVAFEAAVAGGIPVIKTMREGLSANRIHRVTGIINGTCNYILSAMHERGCDFAEMLREAQDLGYAEADASLDVDGTDAAHKISILAAIAFGMPLKFAKVECTGIRHIAAQDIGYASELGFCIKHLAIAARNTAGIAVGVHPALIPQRHLMASVGGVMNAVLVEGDAVGPVLLHGAGAGAEATASAVVADIVDVVRTLTTDLDNRVPHLAFQPSAVTDVSMVAAQDMQASYYLRMTMINRPGVLAEVARILGAHEISIAAVLQKTAHGIGGKVPVILMAERTCAGTMRRALAQITALPTVDAELACIPVEYLEGASTGDDDGDRRAGDAHAASHDTGTASINTGVHSP